ncbi:chondroitin AC/alginate lyase, partial [Basidiobolus meristosporus CBS 931.73]
LAENKQHMLNYDRGLQDSFYTLKRLSDKAIRNGTPYSVTSKAQLAPSSNPHDYLSLARYFWPNNNTANGLPYIRRDGHVNPEITTVPDYKLFRTLVREVQILGLGYYFFENETYALKGISRIRAWFLDDSTRMNPHLHFASFIKGSTEGRRQGLIDFSVVNDMFDVLPFLQRSRYWLQSDTEGLQDWFTKYLEWLDTSKHGFEERNSINNHGTYFDVQYMGIALFLKRNDLALKVAQNASSTRIAAQIALDGSQPHETARAASWFYSIFNLNGLFLLSALSSRVGVDLYHFQTQDGRSIRKAVDYLLPFARQPQTWPFANID